ncbi:Multiple organellar RNA editing factor 8-chloroplastic/mitochondrial [Striga hermonthica]|uniref:Multiple organellar RNA editing factor 8-chloroplastic/mitochondrial n=1 Tax=Striga hermonthica TaxID=68872 RepID=A0A9N7MMD1_STRHE|nr:Multiple organellar RNA editing factor 8-chloroplastic/mitochondrial [Striga hermonthica]
MASRCLARRALLSTARPPVSIVSHSYATAAAASSSSGVLSRPAFVFRLRPLVASASASYFRRLTPAISTRGFATRQRSSPLNDQNPNWSNRPPTETILLDGCDFEHWLVIMEAPDENTTRDEIIDSYIKTLAMVLGSEEEARMKIYSVSTKCYFAFGALVSEELSLKIKELPRVRWVLPDSYLDVQKKDYGGEPFIDGQAVPYDPKYHAEWLRNNSRANERNRRNDRPRNFDRSRNYERNRNFNAPPPQNAPNMGGNMGPPPNFNAPSPHNASNVGGNMRPPQNFNAPPPQNAPNMGPPQNFNAPPPRNAPNMGGQPPQNFNAPPQPNAPNVGGPSGGHGSFGREMPPPNNNYGNLQYGSNSGPGMRPNQGQNQNSGYASQNVGEGNHYQGQNAPPQPPNRGFGQGQNSGGYRPSAGYGPEVNQNSYGQSQNGYGQHGPGPNHSGYGNPTQNQNVPGRDYVN